MATVLLVIAIVLAVNALVILAGYRRQSARPERRRNTTRRGNR
jgi:hypothetical protein